MINQASATKAGLKPGFFRIGVLLGVGPVKLRGLSQVYHYGVAGQAITRRGAWFEREVAPGLSGMLGPMAVPQSRIVWHLRAPAPRERQISLPLVDQGFRGVGTMVGKLFVQFDPQHARSVATAAGGADLAEGYHGAFVGPAHTGQVMFGIERPMRTLRLGTPLSLGGLALRETEVRTSDYGSASTIPDGDAAADEIVVTASVKHKGPVYHVLRVGADALGGCSSLTIDKARRQIVLSCAQP